MPMTCPTAKVKDGEGGYFVINESDFNETDFELFDAPANIAENEGMTAKELKAALDEKGISYKTNSSKSELQELLENA